MLDSLLNWLLRPKGSVLTEGPSRDKNGQIPRRVLAIIAEPSFLYDSEGQPVEVPLVGIGIVFKPPYVRHVSFTAGLLLPQPVEGEERHRNYRREDDVRERRLRM